MPAIKRLRTRIVRVGEQGNPAAAARAGVRDGRIEKAGTHAAAAPGGCDDQVFKPSYARAQRGGDGIKQADHADNLIRSAGDEHAGCIRIGKQHGKPAPLRLGIRHEFGFLREQ